MTSPTGINGLPYAMFTYNTTPHTTTGFTPYELVYGKTASIPTALKNPPKLTYNYEDYAQQTRERIRVTNEAAREQLQEAKKRTKEGYDKKAREIELKVSDKVWLFDKSVRRGKSKKLRSGPYILAGEFREGYSPTTHFVCLGAPFLNVFLTRSRSISLSPSQNKSEPEMVGIVPSFWGVDQTELSA